MKKPQSRLAQLVFFAVVAVTPMSSHAVTDYYLQLEGIDGESTDELHLDWIDVTRVDAQMSRLASGGRVTGAILRPLVIDKTIDAASVPIYLKMLRGEVIQSATLAATKPTGDGQRLEFYRIDLHDVIITSVSTGGAAADEQPTEQVALNFAKICYTYTPIDNSGLPGTPIEACWNVETGQQE